MSLHKISRVRVRRNLYCASDGSMNTYRCLNEKVYLYVLDWLMYTYDLRDEYSVDVCSRGTRAYFFSRRSTFRPIGGGR